MDTPVSFELSTLLKEKGFSEKVRSYFDEKKFGRKVVEFFGKLDANHLTYLSHKNGIVQCGYVSAPTIGEVLKWLIEKHSIWIWVTPQIDLKGEFYWKWYAIKLNHMNPKSATDMIQHPLFHDKNPTPESAYEKGIEFILEKKII